MSEQSKWTRWFYARVEHHEIMPWHLGFAYAPVTTRSEVWILLPFNWPVGLVRSFWLWIARGPRPSRWDSLRMKRLADRSTYTDRQGRLWVQVGWDEWGTNRPPTSDTP